MSHTEYEPPSLETTRNCRGIRRLVTVAALSLLSLGEITTHTKAEAIDVCVRGAEIAYTARFLLENGLQDPNGQDPFQAAVAIELKDPDIPPTQYMDLSSECTDLLINNGSVGDWEDAGSHVIIDTREDSSGMWGLWRAEARPPNHDEGLKGNASNEE